MRYAMFILIFLSIKSAYACPLCPKEAIFIDSFAISSDSDIDEYFEICPTCMDDRRSFIFYLEEKIHRKPSDRMTYTLAYMLGDRLKNSPWPEDRKMALKYIKYSFRLALEYNITQDQHFIAMEDLKKRH